MVHIYIAFSYISISDLSECEINPFLSTVLYKCDKGWKVINDKCLKFVEKKMTWRDASLYCESELYGKLVTIPDADYQSFITRKY